MEVWKFRGEIVSSHARPALHSDQTSVHTLQCNTHLNASARWSSRLSLPDFFEGYVSQFAPHKALKLIPSGKLTFEERVVAHRVVKEEPGFLEAELGHMGPSR